MTKYDFYWKCVERPKRIVEGYVNRLFDIHNDILIQRDVNKHRNELVLDSPFRIVKLLGWTDQYDEDYYWVCYSRHEGVMLFSCVGGFVWLKHRLSGFDYYHMVSVWNMNVPSEKDVYNLIIDKGIILK